MSRTAGILASLAIGLLAPATADAAVWGSFDGTRVNYAGGVLSTGPEHSSLRNIITGNGDTLAASTGTLTDMYLSGVDVFYTSLLNNGAPVLSPAEQLALTDWVAAGGTLIVSGDIFPLPFYESFTMPFGVTGWVDTGASTATPSVMHPITAGVVTIDQVTQSTFTFGMDALELATADDGNPFIIVLEPGTGFCLGGRVLVLGDHNMFANSSIGLADNTALATNIIQWAASGAGGCGVCGNGMIEPGEGCDDANMDDTDACTNACQPAACGDGIVWAGMEACDDANMEDTDDCTSACDLATCGDGFVWAGMETCDDANADDTDDCPSTCEPATCGDGFVWAGMEECDDGNEIDDDECSNACESSAVGSTGDSTGGDPTDGGEETGDPDTGGSGGGSDAADDTGSDDGAIGTTGDGMADGSTGGSSSGGASDDGGCACSTGDRGTPSWMPMLGLLGLLRRRRGSSLRS